MTTTPATSALAARGETTARSRFFAPDRVAYFEKAGWEAYYDRQWLRVLRLMVRATANSFACLCPPPSPFCWASCGPAEP